MQLMAGDARQAAAGSQGRVCEASLLDFVLVVKRKESCGGMMEEWEEEEERKRGKGKESEMIVRKCCEC